MKSFSIIFLTSVTVIVVLTGIFCFILPFDKTVTVIHSFFSILMVLAIFRHLLERRKGLAKHLSFDRKNLKKWSALGIAGLLILIFLTRDSLVDQFLSYSYENRHSAQIFRTQNNVFYQNVGEDLKVLKKANDIEISLEVDLTKFQNEAFMAIWAEDDQGRIIETLFLSEPLKFKKVLNWQGLKLKRSDILPVWAHGWQALKPQVSDLDAISSATIRTSFSMNTILKNETPGFYIKMELNILSDENENFNQTSENFLLKTKEGLGQPSVIYSTYIDLQQDHFDSYYLLKYEGRGDTSSENGEVIHSSEGLTSARKIVKKALLQVTFL